MKTARNPCAERGTRGRPAAFLPRVAPLGTLLLCVLLAGGTRADVVPLDRIAALVDNDVVMESDIARRIADVTQQMAARGATPPPGEIMRRQVRERLVLESIQSQLARRGGLRIDDETLNGAITGIAKQNGLDLRSFIDRLVTEGMDYATFREDVRRDMLASRLRQRLVGDRVHVSDADIDEYLRSAEGRDIAAGSYRLAHILVAVPEAADVAGVQAAQKTSDDLAAQARGGADFGDLAVRNSDAANALEGGDLGWRPAAQLPLLYAKAVTAMKPGDIVGPLRSGSGFHVLKLLDYQADAARVIEQAKVRHVLVKTSAIRTAGEARELAQQLHDRVVAGEDFAAIARKHSDDPGSALSGGDLGWVSQGQMVEEFERAMLDTGTGAFSGVFESQFGYHFLQVLERRRQDTSDDYRRLQARNAVWKRKFEAETEAWLREIRNEAFVEIKGE